QFNFLSPYSKYNNNTTASVNTSPGLSNKLLTGVSITANNNNTKNINAVGLMRDAINSAGTSTNQYTGNIQEGMLFIGLENLKPLQSISMLFQFAEGSAEDEDDDPPAINWSYLSYNEWKPLRAENVVIDDTYGFQTTGIIKIDMPSDVSSNNTIITEGLTWLCASVDKYSNRIPQLINIVTQAVEAQFQDNGNDQSHFDNALPAGSISKLSSPVAQVSKVSQLFASFDGKHKEIGKGFYTRVSERLRHKARAINAWDYEHLVLDRFPSIYKVKCITHTDPNCLCTTKQEAAAKEKIFQLSYNADGAFNSVSVSNYIISLIENELKNFSSATANIIGYGTDASDLQLASKVAKKITDKLVSDGIAANRITNNTSASGIQKTIDIKLQGYPSANTDDCCGPQIAPGHVLIVPIANLKNRNAANPLQPKTSRRTLIEIQEYLKTRTSPFVHVYAKNPVYEQIIVQFKVQFIQGTDKGYYIKQLNNEIVQFLTPWAFIENADVAFNQKIYASSIINFIEERSYVDFITDFVMGVCCYECCPLISQITNGGTIEGNVFDIVSDEGANENSLPGVTIKIKELNLSTTTDENGHYEITGIPPGSYTLIAYFSLFNIKQQILSIPD
ncbi:MAG TPA: carboxypeptidase-like regulatory domain-containing protein, partial [Parafilimonas sp.]